MFKMKGYTGRSWTNYLIQLQVAYSIHFQVLNRFAIGYSVESMQFFLLLYTKI